MNAEERRTELMRLLQESKEPQSGSNLSKQLGVSRQIIVQDIALLRANQINILSTNQGYLIPAATEARKVFKVRHTDEQVEQELSLFVDCGGRVEDVFVYHKIYGLIKANLNIRSRLDVKHFMDDLHSGKSSLLKNVTDSYHYHTVSAENEELLKYIEDELWKNGFLAPIQDYEPEEFERQLAKANARKDA